MTFVCDQEWSEMPATTNGRYCGECEREIIDFRNYSLLEIHELKKENPELCGIFDISQTNQTKPIEFNFLSKSFAIASTLFLLNTADVKAQNIDSVKTEQRDTKNSNTHCNDISNNDQTATTTTVSASNTRRKNSGPLMTLGK